MSDAWNQSKQKADEPVELRRKIRALQVQVEGLREAAWPVLDILTRWRRFHDDPAGSGDFRLFSETNTVRTNLRAALQGGQDDEGPESNQEQST